MENPIKIDDLGGFPIFLETPKWESSPIFGVNIKNIGNHHPNSPRKLHLKINLRFDRVYVGRERKTKMQGPSVAD